MRNIAPRDNSELEAIEQREWRESLEYVIQQGDRDRVQRLLGMLRHHARMAGVSLPFTAVTPYVNTIRAEDQTPLPGSQEIERRIKSLVRWNAMAMVVRGQPRVGRHRRPHLDLRLGRDALRSRLQPLLPRQGATATATSSTSRDTPRPGIYARAFLEGRLSVEQLENFRRELAPGGGLSSYPHPWLMPDFWEFPTVSMGLGPIMSIYQARFNRYLEDRGLKTAVGPARSGRSSATARPTSPKSLGAISLAAREKLDNLIFVINCNLQRLDGPVAATARSSRSSRRSSAAPAGTSSRCCGAATGIRSSRATTTACSPSAWARSSTAQYQKYAVEAGAYFREHFFGTDPRLLEMVKHLSDDQLKRLRLGGHDPVKVYNAYKAAVETQGPADRRPGAHDQGLRARRGR